LRDIPKNSELCFPTTFARGSIEGLGETNLRASHPALDFPTGTVVLQLRTYIPRMKSNNNNNTRAAAKAAVERRAENKYNSLSAPRYVITFKNS